MYNETAKQSSSGFASLAPGQQICVATPNLPLTQKCHELLTVSHDIHVISEAIREKFYGSPVECNTGDRMKEGWKEPFSIEEILITAKDVLQRAYKVLREVNERT